MALGVFGLAAQPGRALITHRVMRESRQLSLPFFACKAATPLLLASTNNVAVQNAVTLEILTQHSSLLAVIIVACVLIILLRRPYKQFRGHATVASKLEEISKVQCTPSEASAVIHKANWKPAHQLSLPSAKDTSPTATRKQHPPPSPLTGKRVTDQRPTRTSEESVADHIPLSPRVLAKALAPSAAGEELRDQLFAEALADGSASAWKGLVAKWAVLAAADRAVANMRWSSPTVPVKRRSSYAKLMTQWSSSGSSELEATLSDADTADPFTMQQQASGSFKQLMAQWDEGAVGGKAAAHASVGAAVRGQRRVVLADLGQVSSTDIQNAIRTDAPDTDPVRSHAHQSQLMWLECATPRALNATVTLETFPFLTPSHHARMHNLHSVASSYHQATRQPANSLPVLIPCALVEHTEGLASMPPCDVRRRKERDSNDESDFSLSEESDAQHAPKTPVSELCRKTGGVDAAREVYQGESV